MDLVGRLVQPLELRQARVQDERADGQPDGHLVSASKKTHRVPKAIGRRAKGIIPPDSPLHLIARSSLGLPERRRDTTRGAGARRAPAPGGAATAGRQWGQVAPAEAIAGIGRALS
ncbi:hypothetical protein GCM10010187_52990 [Actinomadura coerulea]|nr:hypothetical protein GCM10010187_52990 [Actinomadura coerulea]